MPFVQTPTLNTIEKGKFSFAWTIQCVSGDQAQAAISVAGLIGFGGSLYVADFSAANTAAGANVPAIRSIGFSLYHSVVGASPFFPAVFLINPKTLQTVAIAPPVGDESGVTPAAANGLVQGVVPFFASSNQVIQIAVDNGPAAPGSDTGLAMIFSAFTFDVPAYVDRQLYQPL
jgi:hypothetical protein